MALADAGVKRVFYTTDDGFEFLKIA